MALQQIIQHWEVLQSESTKGKEDWIKSRISRLLEEVRPKVTRLSETLKGLNKYGDLKDDVASEKRLQDTQGVRRAVINTCKPYLEQSTQDLQRLKGQILAKSGHIEYDPQQLMVKKLEWSELRTYLLSLKPEARIAFVQQKTQEGNLNPLWSCIYSDFDVINPESLNNIRRSYAFTLQPEQIGRAHV